MEIENDHLPDTTNKAKRKYTKAASTAYSSTQKKL